MRTAVVTTACLIRADSVPAVLTEQWTSHPAGIESGRQGSSATARSGRPTALVPSRQVSSWGRSTWSGPLTFVRGIEQHLWLAVLVTDALEAYLFTAHRNDLFVTDDILLQPEAGCDLLL